MVSSIGLLFSAYDKEKDVVDESETPKETIPYPSLLDTIYFEIVRWTNDKGTEENTIAKKLGGYGMDQKSPENNRCITNAGAVLLCKDETGEWRFPVVKECKGERVWNLPKGTRGKEFPMDCAIRELQEETGITLPPTYNDKTSITNLLNENQNTNNDYVVIKSARFSERKKETMLYYIVAKVPFDEIQNQVVPQVEEIEDVRFITPDDLSTDNEIIRNMGPSLQYVYNSYIT